MLVKIPILSILAAFLSLTLVGCRHSNPCPYPAFQEIQQNAVERTGHCIHWNHRPSTHCQVRCWIDQILQKELSLDDVIRITLLNNRTLQATYEELGIAQANLIQSGLLKNPIFDLSLKYDYDFATDKILEMGIVQNFLDVLLIPLKKRMARAELEMTKNEILGQVMEVIADTKIAYYSLQAAEQSLALRIQAAQAAEAACDAAKRLHAAGNMTKLFLIIEHSAFEQSKLDVASSEMEVVDAREKLNVMMGLWGRQIDWNLTTQLTEVPKDLPNFHDIENHVIANSLDLQNARKNLCATAARVGIDRTETIFPELGIGVDSEREPDGNWFLGPQVSVGIPLFDFGQARTAAGRAELRQLCHEYQALAVEVRSAARSAISRLKNAHHQVRHYQDTLIPLAEEATAETLLQLNAMQVGVFDILSAKQREIETKQKAIFAYRDYLKAQTQIDLLMNGRMIHKREGSVQ